MPAPYAPPPVAHRLGTTPAKYVRFPWVTLYNGAKRRDAAISNKIYKQTQH
jgi:hypothetical protein